MKRNRFIPFLLSTILLITGCEAISSDISDSSPSEALSSETLSESTPEESSDSTSDVPSEEESSLSETTSEVPSNEPSSEPGSEHSSEVPSSEPSSELPSSEPSSEPSSDGPSSEHSSETPSSEHSSEQPDEEIHPYYTNVSQMTSGTTLLNEVRSLITSTHKKLTTYDGLANTFKRSDADPNKSGNVIWFYSGTSKSFSGFGGSVGQTNREHVWPKDGGSAFPEKTRAGSDAHHLRPMETQLNSTRGSKSFGIVAQTSSNIAKQGNSTTYASGDYLSYHSGNFFYPGKGFRGQTARILFYVQARWGGEYNLSFVLGAGKTKTIGDIETLMKWHLEEPVSPLELVRNEEVYKEQGNRNPFIDVPSYACKIYANDGKGYNSTLKNVCNI